MKPDQPTNQPTVQQQGKPKIGSPNIAVSQGLNVLDVVAPQSIEEDFDYFKINDLYFRTIFIRGYPRFVRPGWLGPVVHFDFSSDISFYDYSRDGQTVLADPERRIAEL